MGVVQMKISNTKGTLNKLLKLIDIPLSSIILCDRSIVCSIVLALEIKANDNL